MLGSGKSSGMVNEASNLKANQNLTNTIEQMNSTSYQKQRDPGDVIPTHRRMTKDEELEQKRLAANAGLAAYDPEAEKKQTRVERGNDGDEAAAASDDSDDELMELRRQRMARMKHQQVQEAAWRGKQHGQYREVGQDDFFNVVVREKGGSDQVCVHFFHKDFERCKVLDRRLSELAQQLLSVRFVKIDAEKSPFLVERLKVMMLPCCLLFKNDVCVDRIVGFQGVQDEDDNLDPELLRERIVATMANYGNEADDLAVVQEASV